MRSRLRWILPAVLVAAILAVVAVRFSHREDGASATRTPVALSTPVAGKTRSVLLFFADPDGQGLVARRADVAAAPDPGTLATQTLALLLRGPGALPPSEPMPLPAIPEGVELRAVFLDGKGTATVDLGHLAEKLGGGTESEVLALWSVVDTLAFNFPADARRVRILVDGHEIESLGHVALDAPLAPRRDLVVGDLPAATGATPATPAPTEAAVVLPPE